MAEAGKIGRESIDSVLGKLKEIDPEAAKLGESLVGAFDDADEEATNFEASTTEKLVKIAAGWFTVQSAIDAVSKVINDQILILENARRAHLTVASAQQEALKNLVGFTPQQQQQLLSVIAPQIQAKTQISRSIANRQRNRCNGVSRCKFC